MKEELKKTIKEVIKECSMGGEFFNCEYTRDLIVYKLKYDFELVYCNKGNNPLDIRDSNSLVIHLMVSGEMFKVTYRSPPQEELTFEKIKTSHNICNFCQREH